MDMDERYHKSLRPILTLERNMPSESDFPGYVASILRDAFQRDLATPIMIVKDLAPEIIEHCLAIACLQRKSNIFKALLKTFSGSGAYNNFMPSLPVFAIILNHRLKNAVPVLRVLHRSNPDWIRSCTDKQGNNALHYYWYMVHRNEWYAGREFPGKTFRPGIGFLLSCGVDPNQRNATGISFSDLLEIPREFADWKSWTSSVSSFVPESFWKIL